MIRVLVVAVFMLAVVSRAAADGDGRPAGSFEAWASMPEALPIGEDLVLRLYVGTGESVSASGAGIPKPLVQLDVPGSVELTGRRLTGYRELAGNEFVQEPAERLVSPGSTEIGFRLISPPGADDTIGINVIAYLASGDVAESDGETDGAGGQAWFVRRRIELPVRPGASVVALDEQATRSDWGERGDVGSRVLQIEQRAPGFVLPRGDGSEVSLAEVLDAGDVIVTTYRAFW